jgi:hypothetical protein
MSEDTWCHTAGPSTAVLSQGTLQCSRFAVHPATQVPSLSSSLTFDARAGIHSPFSIVTAAQAKRAVIATVAAGTAGVASQQGNITFTLAGSCSVLVSKFNRALCTCANKGDHNNSNFAVRGEKDVPVEPDSMLQNKRGVAGWPRWLP